MVGWHHRLSGHEFEQAPGDGAGVGSWNAAVHGSAKSQRQLATETARVLVCLYPCSNIMFMPLLYHTLPFIMKSFVGSCLFYWILSPLQKWMGLGSGGGKVCIIFITQNTFGTEAACTGLHNSLSSSPISPPL